VFICPACVLLPLVVLQEAQLSSLSAASIGALPVTTVGAITGRNDYNMVGGCAGFNAAQFGAMSDSAFAGFNTECCKVLTPAALGGLGRAQARALSDDCFWSMSAGQIRGFSPLGASGISPAMAKGLPAAACAGFHKEQIALFRDFFTQNVCEQWSAACIPAIAPAEFAGFTQECTQRLRALALANLTAAQVSHFQPTTFFILSANQIAALPPAACNGITSKQMALLDFASPANQCTGLAAACTNQLTADAIGSMTPQCASHLSLVGLNSAFFAQLTPAAISQLTASQCGTLTADDLAAIIRPIGLSPACVSGLGATQCSTLTAENLNALQAVSGSFTPECVAAITPAAIQSVHREWFLLLTPAAIAALQPSQCQYLVLPDLDNIQTPLVLSSACLAALSVSTCAVLPSSLIDSYVNQTSSLQAFSDACIMALPCTTVLDLDPAVVRAFNLTSDDRHQLETACTDPVDPNTPESTKVRTILIVVSLSLFTVGVALCACSSWRKRSLAAITHSGHTMRPEQYAILEAGNG
jgi:hypothetical protein